MRGKAILFAWGETPKGGKDDYIGTYSHYFRASFAMDELGQKYRYAQIVGFDDEDRMWIAAEFTHGEAQWYQDSGIDGHGMIELGWPPFDMAWMDEA